MMFLIFAGFLIETVIFIRTFIYGIAFSLEFEKIRNIESIKNDKRKYRFYLFKFDEYLSRVNLPSNLLPVKDECVRRYRKFTNEMKLFYKVFAALFVMMILFFILQI